MGVGMGWGLGWGWGGGGGRGLRSVFVTILSSCSSLR